jgi:CRP-like cAMP-binding protein
MSFVSVLRNTEVFRRLSDEELGKMVRLCTRQSYEAGTQLSQQGKEIRNLYVVEEGLVQFHIEIGPGRSWAVDSSGKDECFGWAALLEPPHTWASSARCVEGTTLVVVGGTKLRELCQREPHIGYAVMLGTAQVLRQRLNHARVQVVHLAERM